MFTCFLDAVDFTGRWRGSNAEAEIFEQKGINVYTQLYGLLSIMKILTFADTQRGFLRLGEH